MDHLDLLVLLADKAKEEIAESEAQEVSEVSVDWSATLAEAATRAYQVHRVRQVWQVYQAWMKYRYMRDHPSQVIA